MKFKLNYGIGVRAGHYCGKLMLHFGVNNLAGAPERGIEMKELTIEVTTAMMALVLLLALTLAVFPSTVSAQMQPWLLQEQARQMAERQQWMLWAQQEQARQTAERQQWVALQRQEQMRQMYQHNQLLQLQQQEMIRQRFAR